MTKQPKRYIIKCQKGVYGPVFFYPAMTIEEAVVYFAFLLARGAHLQDSRVGKKVELNPKTIKGLLKSLTNSEDNFTQHGYADVFYSAEEVK